MTERVFRFNKYCTCQLQMSTNKVVNRTTTAKNSKHTNKNKQKKRKDKEMNVDLTCLTEAMHPFNFWPVRSADSRMESSSFVPNHLSSPALMVLASSAEGREGARLPAPPHPFSSQSLDKDLPAPPPPFSSAGFVYRHGEPFPSPIYAPMPPFPRPSLDRGMGLIGPSGGAFRHLGPHEGAEPYHSAFTPAKKKAEDASCSSTFPSESHEQSYDKDAEGAKVKEERPSSISSAGGDTNSEIHSDSGDLGDRGTPDSEGRTLRSKLTVFISVCAVTLPPPPPPPPPPHTLLKSDHCMNQLNKSLVI